jgi:hypothetical protein
MRRVIVSAVFVPLFAAITCAAHPETALAKAGSTGSDASTGLIRPKWRVSDDPLDGLPDENPARDRGKAGTRGGSKPALCAVQTSPADSQTIGDLRATLAFVQAGPRALRCPTRASATAEIRLRIAIDGAGRITAVETVVGDALVGGALARRLLGKTIASRRDGATVGVVVLAMVNVR